MGGVFSLTYLMGLPVPQRRPLDMVDQHPGRRCGRPRQPDHIPRELCHGQLARAGDFPWKRAGRLLDGRACATPWGDSPEGPHCLLERFCWLESHLGAEGTPIFHVGAVPTFPSSSDWAPTAHRQLQRTHVWSGGRSWWRSRPQGRGR